MEKKGPISKKEEMPDSSYSLAPLAQYDDLAAREVEDLRVTSDAISKEIEAMNAELSRLTEHLDTAKTKEHLNTLYAERAMYDRKILELRTELPGLGEECAALRLTLQESRLEEEYTLVTAQLEELKVKQESLGRELPVLESETEACERFLAETETLLRETPAAIAEIEKESKLVASKSEGLESLDEMMYLISAMEGIGETGEAVVDRSGSYSVEVAALQEELKRKDSKALAHALEISRRLSEEYGHTGKEINELMRLFISKFSFMQELEEKEKLVALINTQSEELERNVDAKARDLDGVKTLNLEDKKKFSALQEEVTRYRKAIAPYAEEVAKGEEIIRKKEAAAAEFVSLFVKKAELQSMAVTADSKMRALKEMVKLARKMS